VASDRPVAPVVFWPGLRPPGRLPVVEPLFARHGVEVHSISPPWDLPTPEDYLPSRLADSVLKTVPFDRFVFMGHSWGGSIGVQLAADHPQRLEGLVLLDAGYSDVELANVSEEQLVAHFEPEWGDRARVAAWALQGVACERQTATHDRLGLPILLLLARDAEGTVPHAEAHRLDASHDILGDRPEETARLVAEWLARLPREE
jgi:pimeloyl-ACP methyl ester carboxylesterase